MPIEIPRTAQGYAVPVESGSEEAQKDELGYTNPNLHRRINEDEESDESYQVLVQGSNSYKTVTIKSSNGSFPDVAPTPQNSTEIP